MADFIIPKGKQFEFTVQVMEFESFLPQDLTTMTTADITLVDYSATSDFFGKYDLVTYGATNDGVLAAAEVTTITIPFVELATYSVAIEGTTYAYTVTDLTGVTTGTIAASLLALMGDMANASADIIVLDSNVITITGDTVGYDLSIIAVSTNLVIETTTTATAGVPSSEDYNIQNGYLKGIIPIANDTSNPVNKGTASMVINRGDAVDGLYLKPSYQGIISVTFTDRPAVTTLIDKIYVAPTGV